MTPSNIAATAHKKCYCGPCRALVYLTMTILAMEVLNASFVGAMGAKNENREAYNQLPKNQTRATASRTNATSGSHHPYPASKPEHQPSDRFPGIYILEYTYHHQSIGNAPLMTALSRTTSTRMGVTRPTVLQRLDVLRVECHGSHHIALEPDIERNNKNAATTSEPALGSNRSPLSGRCEGQVLVHSRDEYEEITTMCHRDRMQKHKGLDFDCTIRYNATLTEHWIDPRLRVAALAGTATNSNNGEIQSPLKRLRRTAEKESIAKGRYDTGETTISDFQEEDQRLDDASTSAMHLNTEQPPKRAQVYDYKSNMYSTIPEHDCYLDYEGTISWIKDFVKAHASSALLEITWSDIGDSWKKTKDPNDGYDIFALTITGKAATPDFEESSSSSSSKFEELFGINENGASENQSSESYENILQKNTKKGKAPLLLVSSTHAREYTPPELVRRWLDFLVDTVVSGIHSEERTDALSMLEHTVIHWIPYLNPDGRVLAETTQPFRRKNLNSEWTLDPRESSVCPEDSYGVDLNRNFPFEWGNDNGSDEIACSPFSRGSGPASEPETIALVEYAKSIFPIAQQVGSNAVLHSGGDYRIVHDPTNSVPADTSSTKWRGFDPSFTKGVFVDVHSYGKVYIYPWGNTNAQSPNDVSFRSAMGHIASLTGNAPLGPGPDHYGVASGATDDWAYASLGAFSMTWEIGRNFHEDCGDFETDVVDPQRHFRSFAYLAKIAPFPFALGKGPIVSQPSDGLLLGVGNEVHIYYQYTGTAATTATNNQFYHRANVHDNESNDDEVLDRNAYTATALNHGSNSTNIEKQVVRVKSYPKEAYTVEADLDADETIAIAIEVKLPERIPQHFEPIEFETDNDDEEEDDSHSSIPPSSISIIRIFYRKNPLVGAKEYGSGVVPSLSDGQYYWDLPFDSSKDDHDTLYVGYLTKSQLWEAFGSNDEEKLPKRKPPAQTMHTLYIQAMDNAGNWGPVTGTKLTVVIMEETKDIYEKDTYPYNNNHTIDDWELDDFFGPILGDETTAGHSVTATTAPAADSQSSASSNDDSDVANHQSSNSDSTFPSAEAKSAPGSEYDVGMDDAFLHEEQEKQKDIDNDEKEPEEIGEEEKIRSNAHASGSLSRYHYVSVIRNWQGMKSQSVSSLAAVVLILLY